MSVYVRQNSLSKFEMVYSYPTSGQLRGATEQKGFEPPYICSQIIPVHVTHRILNK